MKLKISQIILSLFGIILLINISVISTWNYSLAGNILSLISLLIIPGILSFLILKLIFKTFWETLVIIVGLSLSFLMFGGLFINQILPIFGIHDPLALMPTLISFDILFILFFILAFIRNRDLTLTMPKFNINKYTLMLSIPLLLFPVLATMGAISLNNGGSNIFTMIMLGGIGLYILVLTIFRDKVSQSLFPTSLYFIGLALLLMTSLRSWYITGHDIQTEYYVFQLTKTHNFWSVNLYRDAYNACLSITILPTILYNFLHFNDVYIYKFIFQLLFATCPVIVYLFLKKYTSSLLAFISTIYFISFPTFYNDMPMLNRQEIGFIFFALMLLVLFHDSYSKKFKNILLIIFGFSIVVSHYSTNYVLLILLLFSYLIAKFSNFALVKRYIGILKKRMTILSKIKIGEKTYINIFVLVALLTFTFFWNNQFTKTGNNLGDTIDRITHSFLLKSDNDKSVDISYSIFSFKKISTRQLLDNYILQTINEAKVIKEGSFYDKNISKNYKTIPLSQEIQPLTSNYLVSFRYLIFLINSLTRQTSALFMQISVVLGIICIFLYRFSKKIDKEYLLLCISGFFLLIIFLSLPSISVEYGLLRLFQQLLMLFSLSIVIFTLIFAKYFKKKIFGIIVIGIPIFFFLTLTGFISTLTGGYYGQLNLNNSGLYYDAYYTKKQDVLSAHWLAISRDKSTVVQTDTTGFGKLNGLEGIYSLKEIFPPIIRKNSYVYLAQGNHAIVSIESNILIFSSPQNFLNNNKNLIYNNGLTNIYK